MHNRFKQLRQEWEEKLKAWRASGQSGADWCQQENIPYKTFCNWKYRLSAKPLSKESFIELKEEKTSGIDLEYQGIRIHLTHNFDPCTLKKCLQALKGFAC